MGLKPDHWGPYFWGTIHIACLGAPESLDEFEKVAYRTFITTLPFILPCGSCGKHFYELLQAEPIEQALKSRQTLFEWSVRAHNIVNKRLGKPEVSQINALRHWSLICMGEASTCPTKTIHTSTKQASTKSLTTQDGVIIVSCLLIVGAIGYYYVSKTRNV